MSSSPRPSAKSLAVSPIINFPGEAETGETYLLTVDLAPRQSLGAWPYPADEEVVIYCLVNAEPLFSAEPLGEPAVVVHRFGGTYGPARFLITAAREPQEGVIQINLVNGMGVPLTSFETPIINIRERVEHKEAVDFLVRRRTVAVTEEVTADVSAQEPPVLQRAGRPARIFISSTYQDLQEYRAAVAQSIQRLGHEAVLLEHLGTTPTTPLDKSYEDLAACDLYIGIFAWRYGYIPQDDNPEQLSLPELEYRRAVALKLPRLIFLLSEDAPWPASNFEAEDGIKKMLALRQELMSSHIASFFGNVEELAARVTAAVVEWSRRWRRRSRGGKLSITPLPPTHISLGRLPVTGSELVGRESEVEWLEEMWADADIHIASLVGWGGVGKSALVNLWLSQMSRENYRGAQRVFAWSFYEHGGGDGQESPNQFIYVALQWFGDADPTAGTAWDRGERLASIVGAQCALIVLDGLEMLQYPPGPNEGNLTDVALRAFLRQLAAYNEGLCVITTRVPVADLRNYSAATSLDLEPLSPREGAKLLKQHGIAGTQAELEAAVQEFDGHPLSLTLLGSYLSDAFGGDIGRRHEVKWLEEDERYGRLAHDLLTSYERWLGEGPELAVLRILSLSTDALDRAAFDAVRAAPAIEGLTEGLQDLSEQRLQQILSKLRRANLLTLQAQSQPSLLNTHPLVREHFSHQLIRLYPGAWRDGNNRLYEHYKLVAKEFPDTLEEMKPLYAAVNHGCAAGRHQEVLDEIYHRRILRGDQLFNQEQLGEFSHDLAVLSNFFVHPWTKVVGGLKESSQGLVLTLASHNLRAVGRLRESIQPLQTYLDVTISRQRWIDAAIAANNLCETYVITGDLSEALAIARRSVEFADRGGEMFRRFATRATLASTVHQLGRLTEAEEAFREAEKIQRELQSQPPFLYSIQGFQYCDLLLDQGKYQEVLTRAKQSLEWATQQSWRLGVALNRLSAGRAQLLLGQLEGTGDFAAVTGYLSQAVAELRRAGTIQYLPWGLLARAELCWVKGEFEQAQVDLDEAMSIAMRGSMGLHEADCHLGYARLYLARGEVEEAHTSLERAREMVDRIGYHRRDSVIGEIERQINLTSTNNSVSVPEQEKVPADKVTAAHDEFDAIQHDRQPSDSKRDPYRLIGTTLAGKYQLIEFVGSGGMAAVYRSLQLKDKKWVAAKILKPDILARSPDYAELFAREAQVVRSLVHPHIAEFIDTGATNDDIQFIITEWLDGETLDELLTRSPVLPIKRVINIVAQICDALSYAHNNKIIHLDVKPANIFLLRDAGSNDNVKLIDFGLSRILSIDAGITVTRFRGTHQYCAPESFGGRVNYRSDIYSLGATLYYMLSGIVPFSASYINAKIHPNLELPEIPSLLTVRPDLPQAVYAVIQKALSKNPEDRQGSVKQFFNEFSTACGGDVTSTKYRHLFLVYCHDNLAEVTQLREDLINAGENVWWDQDIKPGQDWKFAIRQAMKQSYAVILCLSEESQRRTISGIYPEALDAITAYREYSPGSVFIIPVRLSDCEIPPIEIDATRTLERIQYVDLFPASSWNDGISSIVEAIHLAPHYP